MTKSEAAEAISSMCDVRTNDGDCGTIAYLSTRNGVRGAHVQGAHVSDWFPIEDLYILETSAHYEGEEPERLRSTVYDIPFG